MLAKVDHIDHLWPRHALNSVEMPSPCRITSSN
jgi:hypothetical protein